MNGLYKEENISQPDNTVNTLLKLLNTARQSGVDLPSGYRTPSAPPPVNNALYDFYNPPQADTGGNALLNPMPVTPALQEATPVLPDATSVTPTTPVKNALLRTPTPTPVPMAQKPVNSLLDYWSKPVIGKMPLDQFVQIAGALSSAIAPREAVGRVGNVLSQIGGAAYAERLKREDPENVLRRRLLEAQITEAETKPWPIYLKEKLNTINQKTGKPFTTTEALKDYHKDIETPKEPTPQYKERIENIGGVDKLVNVETLSGKRFIVGDATKEDKRRIVTGKVGTEPLPSFQEYKRIPGNEGKTYEDFKKWEVGLKAKEVTPKSYEPHRFIKPDGTIGWVEPGKEVPKGWKPYEKAEKLSIGDAHTIYNTRMNGIKTRMMIDMTPDEQAVVANQPTENIMALLLSGRIGKSLNPTKKEQFRREILDAETEFNDLSGGVLKKKGVKIPTKVVAPEAGIVEGATISSRGKVVPAPFPRVPAPIPLPEKKKPAAEKGKTFSIRDIVDAGGIVKYYPPGVLEEYPNGVERVWDKDRKFMGERIK